MLVTNGCISAPNHLYLSRSNYANQLQNAQDNAKAAQKRIWKDYVESADPVGWKLMGIFYTDVLYHFLCRLPLKRMKRRRWIPKEK